MELQYLQYLLITALVIAVIIWQFNTYRKNEERIKRLKNLFPQINNSRVAVVDDTTVIVNENARGEFKETLDDINSYLAKNKNKTFDYHILKEIVNRNSQSLEDEVDTMLPTPLYLGLIATIFGIAIGIIIFAWKDLAGLLSGGNSMNSEGIKVLLTDVGIAMFASLAGVFATKLSTSHFNEAKSVMSKNKNRFLTWIQTDLMSKLSDDITGAILKMTNDLNEFNRTFSQNTQELRQTLSTVNDSYEGQVRLLEAIDKIKINKIAKANIEVYDRLEGCTEELEKLFTIISNSEEYVAKVTALNDKLGSVEERTQLFEELGNYFKNEVEYVKDRQGMMRQHMSSLDSVLQEALSNMGDSLRANLQNLLGVFQSQNQGIQQLIEEQQRAMADSLIQQQLAVNEKIDKIENPFTGMKEMFEQGISSMNQSFADQNTAIKEMLAAQNLALEEALSTQQAAIIQKLKDAPNQLSALSDIAKAVDRLNQSIARVESQTRGNSVPQPLIGGTPKEDKPVGFFGKFKQHFVHICAGGSFLILLAMLLLMLFGK